MTDFTNFLDDIRKWAVHPEYDDALVTSFVRLTETTLDQVMRVREMVVRADAIITEGRVLLPGDWIEAELIRGPDGKPLEYKTPTDFYNAPAKNPKWFTVVGSTMEFGAPIDLVEGTKIAMDYFQYLPTFVDNGTYLYNRYYNIFLQACLAAAFMYGQEEDKAAGANAIAGNFIEAANATYTRSKISGSLLKVSGGKAIGGGYRGR